MTESANSAEPGVQRALDSLKSVLIPGETLEAWAIQRRIFALTHRRVLVAATSGRLISITRGLIGGFSVTDIRWQDLEDVDVRVGIFAADLTVRVGKSTDLASGGASSLQSLLFTGLRKDQAQAVYRICQAQDQAWREKRRVRELEELRARSGGIHLNPQSSAVPSDAGGASDAVRRLQEAKKLLDAKLITDAEYEAIKAKIVAST
jgi:Bacterial PH domain